MDEASIFLEALKKPAPDARAAFLDRACGGNEELRRSVELLLKAHEKAGGFLAPPSPSVDATVAQSSSETAGTVIGAYKLVEPIGEGGMGTVWMAQQTEPVKRLVALKLIKAGMDSKQVIARFEAERQALALMDHPNIAKVLDGGTTSTGRPYFVMDLVKGVPITKYCDEHHLTPRQRLELFVPVCQAVQHAHQKGIIHRDLKPSNVLVALYGGRPVPKVIDFGVAKAAGQPLTDRTLVTGFGAIVGTLEYMSPEQAEVNQLDIDTRSDIYSLGVLLYELLTGSPPFTRKDLEKAGMLEMLRVIREQEPSKPSTKLSTAEGLPTLAANRGTEPAKLTRLVRGELDWIVMKALEKDRSRRYETANGFALDVQRYLADEPVLACPPSASYRLRKFARRNKRALATLTLLGLMLFAAVGAVAATMGWAARDRATRREEAAQQARESLARARTWVAEDKLALARQELAEAQGRIGSDRAALGSLAKEVEALESELRNFERFHDLVNQAHEEEIPQPKTMVVALETVPGMESPLPRMRDFFVDPAKVVPLRLQALSCYQVMERPDWSSALDRRLLGPGQIAKVRHRLYEELIWLAVDLLNRGQDHRSGRKMSPAEAAREALAYLQKAEQAFGATKAFYMVRARCRKAVGDEEAARVDQALAGQTPATIALDHFLPDSAANRSLNRAEAVKKWQAALRVEPTHYESLIMLGWSLSTMGEQEQDFTAAVAAFTGCIMKRPDHANAYLNRGYAFQRLGRHEDALADYSRAIELCPKLVSAWNNRGLAYAGLGQPDKALADYSKAIELDPKLSHPWHNRGNTYDRLGHPDKALADYSRAIELDRTHEPTWYNRGVIHGQLGQYARAIADYSKAIEIKPDYVNPWYNRGYAYGELRQFDKAIADYSRAIELKPDHPDPWQQRGATYAILGQYDKALADLSRAIELKPDHAGAWCNRGAVYSRRGEYQKALAEYSQAIAIKSDLAEAWNNRGDAHQKLNQLEKAIGDYSKAIEIKPELLEAWHNRGTLYLNRGEFDKAVADFSRAIELKPNLTEPWYHRGRAHYELGHLDKALSDTSKAVELKPDYAEAWDRRVWIHARLNRWNEAVADQARVVELRRDDPQAWYRLGLLRIYSGDADGYRKVCADMVRHFGRSEAPNVVHHLVFTCALGPNAGADFRPLLQAAEKLAAEHPKHWWHVNRLGVARYRAGRLEAAVATLNEATQLSGWEGYRVRDWLILAMAHHGLGQAEDAEKCLAKADEWMAKHAGGLDWPDRLGFEVLHGEAQQLIRKRASGPNATGDKKQ